MASIVSYVAAVTDEKSEDYVPEEERIAVFDVDGTLYGELFPTYFDEVLLLHRLLHDKDYQASEEDRAYAEATEKAFLSGQPEPDSPRSSAQMAAEAFRGFTVEEYCDYVREFMKEPVAGFDNMTYGEGFYLPMVELVKYTYQPEDEVLLQGNLLQKNQKMNKVISIVDEIGVPPVLVFGNSSGDLSMDEYAVQNGGKAYMLLCDDTERDYGDLEVAAEFADECSKLGFETISMRDEFETIYKEDAVKTSRK